MTKYELAQRLAESVELLIPLGIFALLVVFYSRRDL
jgi:hypothetical protein